MNVVSHWPTNDCWCLPWIYLDAFQGYHIMSEDENVDPKITFGELDIAFLLSSLLRICAGSLNIVFDLYYSQISSKWTTTNFPIKSEYMIHKIYDGAWSIREPKWHHKPLMKTISCFECHLLFITLPHSNLKVSTLAIKLD